MATAYADFSKMGATKMGGSDDALWVRVVARRSVAGREFDRDRFDGTLDVGTSEVGDEVVDSI